MIDGVPTIVIDPECSDLDSIRRECIASIELGEVILGEATVQAHHAPGLRRRKGWSHPQFEELFRGAVATVVFDGKAQMKVVVAEIPTPAVPRVIAPAPRPEIRGIPISPNAPPARSVFRCR